MNVNRELAEYRGLMESFQFKADRLIDLKFGIKPYGIAQDIVDIIAPTDSLITMGWLEIARTARSFTQSEIARRLKINRSAYHRLEASETRGKINMETLRRAAATMDCELVYVIRPLKGSFADRH